jgi:thiamine biosynthesis lipoprotein ApbE
MNASDKPWRVAIQKPTDQQNAVQAIVDINGHGISTSGATVTITSSTVSAFRMLSIRRRASDRA